MIRVSAPGSVMLLGEHAVLQGYSAVVSAVNYRMSVALLPRKDERVVIRSSLGDYDSNLSELVVVPPFEYVLTAIQSYQSSLPSGFDLIVESSFSHEVGLGSSAAITVSVVFALALFLSQPIKKIDLFNRALSVVRSVQGVGSGADVAASVFGSTLAYRWLQAQVDIQPLGLIKPKLSLFYSGSKLKTAEVLSFVKDRFNGNEVELQTIYEHIGKIADRGIHAIQGEDWSSLGECFNEQQVWMEKLGVTNEALRELLDKVSVDPNLLGAKISGSGLGDCIVTLGDLYEEDELMKKKYIPVSISQSGVQFE